MKFKIDNRSKYQTRHLRAYVVRAYAVAAEFAGAERVARYEATFRELTVRFARANHRGKHGSTGHAYYFSAFAHVGLGDEVDPYAAAYVIAHEIAHCFGMRHPEMSGGALMTHDREIWAKHYPWAATLPLEKRQPKAKPPAEAVAAQKRAALVVRLERWEAKQRRAERAVKKLRTSLKAYDRRLERKAALPPT